MPSYPCRCRRAACQARQTKAMHPDEYLRQPKCRMCRRGLLRIYHYRTQRENRNPCMCWAYSFPHARGRGWCEHNHRITAEMMEERMRTMGARVS